MNANIGAARGEFGPLDGVILHEPDNTPQLDQVVMAEPMAPPVREGPGQAVHPTSIAA
jgi:hypothetical protein